MLSFCWKMIASSFANSCVCLAKTGQKKLKAALPYPESFSNSDLQGPALTVPINHERQMGSTDIQVLSQSVRFVEIALDEQLFKFSLEMSEWKLAFHCVTFWLTELKQISLCRQ